MPASVVSSWSLSLLFSGYKSCLFPSIKEHLNLYSYLSWNVWEERKTQWELAKWSCNLIGEGLQGLHRNFLHWEPLLPDRPPHLAPRAAPVCRKCTPELDSNSKPSSPARLSQSIISCVLLWSTFTRDPLTLKRLQPPKGGEDVDKPVSFFS